MRILSTRTRWVVALLCSLIVFFGLSPATAQSGDPDQAPVGSAALAVSPQGLISQSSTGQRVDIQGASGGSVSADGAQVAFESASDALDTSRGDSEGNGFTDVFVRDRDDQITIHASRAITGLDADGHSFGARMSGNGRYVAFTSLATDLIRNDRNEVADAFIHDLETGITRLVSIADRGIQLDVASRLLDVSDTGRHVLIAVQTDSEDSVLLRVVDWVDETVADIGEADGQVGGADGPSASLSGDGGTVAFRSSEQLSDEDTDTESDIYLTTTADADLIELVSGSAEIGVDVLLAADSDVLFYVEDDPVAGWSLLRLDRSTDESEIVTLGEDGTAVSGLDASLKFGANRDGTSVVWSTDVSISDDLNGQPDVFKRNLVEEVTHRVSLERHGFELSGASLLTATMRAVSDDALVVAFTSTSNELVPNDTNRAADVFVATPASTCDDQFITVFTAAGELPTERDDVILGSNRNDRIDAGGGDDIICGGDGQDIIFGGEGNDRIFGELGDDIIEGGEGRDFIDGGVGADKLYGDEDRDELIGGRGGDLLEGGGGRDRLLGGSGADRVLGERGADFLDGGSGNDELFGGASNDKVLGRGGDDLLRGGGGRDTLRAGRGADELDGGDGKDSVDGGSGSDTCQFDERSPNETVTNCEQ